MIQSDTVNSKVQRPTVQYHFQHSGVKICGKCAIRKNNENSSKYCQNQHSQDSENETESLKKRTNGRKKEKQSFYK